MSIMSEWVSKGELNDRKQEFFIRTNEKLQDPTRKVSSKVEWRDSFVFRTVNLREVMVQGGFVPP